MKITDIKIEKLDLVLHKPIVVALGVIESISTILIKIETDSGICGYGESAYFGPVTGESFDSVVEVIKNFKRILVGMNPLKIEKIHTMMNRFIAYNPAAKAGIDIALHDIYAKTLEVPLYVALGGSDDSYSTDKTISIGSLDEMLSDAGVAVSEGFDKLKLKAGLDVEHDMKVMKKMREVYGHDLTIRMDANQGWNVTDAVKAINFMEQYKLDAIEQPTAYWDIDSLTKIKGKINVPLMADESLHNEFDAIKLIRANAADVFNIKLMKSSGIFGATKINYIGEAAGIPCMIGCMGESPVGITAAAHFAAAKKNVTRVDLDSIFAFKECKNVKGGVKYNAGKAKLPDAPGLGIELDF